MTLSIGYNYVDRWWDRREKFYSIDRHAYPDRRFVGTQTNAIFRTVTLAASSFALATPQIGIEVSQAVWLARRLC
jgi:hypothetical protein